MSLNPTVLFLASWYPTNEKPTHGIFIQNHAKALAQFTPVIVVYAYSTEAKIKNEIQAHTNGNLTEYLLPYKKVQTKIPILKHYLQYRNYIAAYKTFLNYLIRSNQKVQAIQVNVVFPVSMALSIFKDYFKVEHTIIEHWSGYLKEDGNYKGFILKHFTKICFKSARKIWHISDLQKQSLIHHGLTGNFELIYNAVDTKVFKPLNESKNSAITFLHVSSLVEREKNLKGTFLALKLLQEKNYSFELVIIGGEPDSIESTKLLQNEIGLKHVSYKGYQTKEAIRMYMNKCHALLLFSHFEGMPVVVLEALACGLPVLASPVGQLPKIIQNDFGRLAENNNETAYVKILENFIQGNYEFHSEKMRDFILKHASYEAVGKQMFDFYSKH